MAIQEHWIRAFGTVNIDSVNSIAIDSSSAIYAVGNQGWYSYNNDSWALNDAFIRKYSAAGALLWSTTLASAKADLAYGVIVNGDDSIIVWGSIGADIPELNFKATQSNQFVAKYSASGSLLWIKSDSLPTPMTQSPDGNIIGYSGSKQNLVKFDSNGQILWTQPLSASSGEKAVATNDSIFVYGNKYHDSDTNGIVEKYSSTGSLIWTRIIGSVGNYDDAVGAVVDTLGNFYLIGTKNGTNINGGFGAAYLIKYDTSGTKIWEVTLQLGNNYSDAPTAISISKNNEIVIARELNYYQYIDVYSTSGLKLSSSESIYVSDKYYASKINSIDSIAISNDAQLFIAGEVDESISNQIYLGGLHDGFVAKLSTNFLATPVYSITSGGTSVNEGSTAYFTISTQNLASGSTITYSLNGISFQDIQGYTLKADGTISGTTVIGSNGISTIAIPISADNLTEGAESLSLSLQGKSASILINDTSKSVATYSLSANSTSVNEGATATFILTTTNVAAGTSISYTISGITAADLALGSLSGISTVATNGQASITINLANDNLTEGTETLTVLAQGQTATTLVNDTSKSNTSTFPTVLTQQQMQNAPALAFTAFTPTDPEVKWNFSSFFFGTNLLGKDFNPTSFYASASSIYDFNALSIDDPDYLAIFDSTGNLITSSSESKDWAAWVDSSGNSYDYDNIFAWSPPKDGTYYLGVVLSQTSSTPFYSFGGYETRATVTSIPFGNGKYFYGSSGPDNIVGTPYADVFKQTSTSASNQLTKLADGSWRVQNKLTSSNSDNLVNVERIEFNDMSVALDVSGPAGQVAKILGSVFGKSYLSNTVFAGIGLAYLDGGMTYLDLCGLAAGAAGLTTPDLLITTLLRNTTGAEPTALSKSSYLASIASGASYASVVQQIADSSANAQSIKLTDLANTGLAYTPYVLPPTYSLNATTATVNEGSTAVFNLTTTNVAVGAEFSYTLSGVSQADLTSSTLTGKVIIGVGGTASISIPIAADGATEGQESLTIIAQGATASIVINDTSKSIASPTYTLTPATTSINEGVLAQVYVSTTNVAAGTSLQFGISGVGITQGDVIEGLSRFVTVDSTGKAVININTVADQLTEGPETMFITLGTSTTSIIMNDTSVTLVGIPDGGGGDGGGSGGGGGGD